MRKFMAYLLILAGIMGLCACGKAEVPTETLNENSDGSRETVSFTDDLGQEFNIERPKRVVTMIGSFADIWCLAGGKDSLVATAGDTWTSFDLGLSEDVLDLGAIKDPSLEVLISAQPDFIIASCNTTANLNLQETFAEMGINAAYFDVQNINDYLRMLKICTLLTGCDENYKTYGEEVQAQANAAKERQDGSEPEVLCLRATGSGVKAKSSKDNLLGEMLKDMGCRNIADSETNLLEELNIEAIIDADPEYIFAVMQGSNSEKAMKAFENALMSNPAWNELTAVKEGRFYILEHELFNLKPNARWGLAYEKLADILYPEK